MRREVVIYIDGVKADTYKDLAVTLDFNSSILADVLSIKCSGSKTIRLPKTQTNDRIFDLPHLPSYESSKAHVKMPCSVYVGGITIIDKGLCYLLASDGDHYEVAVTFGVMHSFEQWLKDKPKLTDLTKGGRGDSVPWNKTSGVTTWGNSAIFYAKYNCIKEGDNSMYHINIHPSVTLAELWRRITQENNLDITFDGSYLDDMARKAILLTKNNNTSLQTITQGVSLYSQVSYVEQTNISRRLLLNVTDCFDVGGSSFVQKGYKQVVINLPEIYLSIIDTLVDSSSSYYQQSALDFFKSTSNCYLVFEYPNGDKNKFPPTSVSSKAFKWSAKTLTFDKYEGEEYEGQPLVKVYVEVNKWGSVPTDVWENPNSGKDTKSWAYPMVDAFKFRQSGSVAESTKFTIDYKNNSNDYPLAAFNLVENLPDITQMDFINFICKFYGLFPMQKGDGVVLMPFSRLFDNIEGGNVYDWSEVLTEQYTDCPDNIAQTIDGYAQRNSIGYKEDKNDNAVSVSYLVVEDETLENDKKFIEFPFAATNGAKVPQYTINADESVEKNECEYRLMTISKAAGEQNNTASFTEDLKAVVIKNKHYASLQDVIRKPMQIDEMIDLSLIDLQALDYSKPVYLAKYGRYFAIISVQWQSDSRLSKVKLLRIR